MSDRCHGRADEQRKVNEGTDRFMYTEGRPADVPRDMSGEEAEPHNLLDIEGVRKLTPAESKRLTRLARKLGGSGGLI